MLPPVSIVQTQQSDGRRGADARQRAVRSMQVHRRQFGVHKADVPRAALPGQQGDHEAGHVLPGVPGRAQGDARRGALSARQEDVPRRRHVPAGLVHQLHVPAGHDDRVRADVRQPAGRQRVQGRLARAPAGDRPVADGAARVPAAHLRLQGHHAPGNALRPSFHAF